MEAGGRGVRQARPQSTVYEGVGNGSGVGVVSSSLGSGGGGSQAYRVLVQ